MGAGILPVCKINNKIYFLFGKERNIDENPGWSDFGGGSDPNESFFETATRECSEEISGFLGSKTEIKNMLNKNGYLNIFLPNEKSKSNGYKVYITPIKYDPYLSIYFNNHQKFIHKNLDAKIIKSSKLFEKTEIKWFSFEDIKKNKKKFRNFYQRIIHILLENKDVITKDIQKLISK